MFEIQNVKREQRCLGEAVDALIEALREERRRADALEQYILALGHQVPVSLSLSGEQELKAGEGF